MTEVTIGAPPPGKHGAVPFLAQIGAHLIDVGADSTTMGFRVPELSDDYSRLGIAAAFADAVTGSCANLRLDDAHVAVTGALSVWSVAGEPIGDSAGQLWTGFARITARSDAYIVVTGEIRDEHDRHLAHVVARIIPVVVPRKEASTRGSDAVAPGWVSYDWHELDEQTNLARAEMWPLSLSNSTGVMHGGAVALQLDIAAHRCLGPGLAPHGIELAFLSPVFPGSIEIASRVLRAGRRSATVRSELSSGDLAATATVHFGRAG